MGWGGGGSGKGSKRSMRGAGVAEVEDGSRREKGWISF